MGDKQHGQCNAPVRGAPTRGGPRGPPRVENQFYKYDEMNLCTWNLHNMVCRMLEQGENCGWNIAADNELFVERRISAVKKSARYHVSQYPASYVASLVLFRTHESFNVSVFYASHENCRY